jgi:predicted MFS family arabinose efflux permease|tara:strand:- start:170 stop:1528 length:1359 start_codon:yes stop_codon:yes gene_type:complete
LTETTHFSSIERRATLSIASLFGFRMLGLFMVLPVLALATGDYPDFTPLMLGITLGAYGLTQAILQIPLGLLSDRIGRQPVIIGGLLMFIAGSIVAALADTMIGLVIGRALQGTGAIASTLMALVADLTGEQNRSKAMATIGGSIGFSFMLAMILGPLLAANFGLPSVFWVTAALGVVGIFIAQFLVPKAVSMRRNREAMTDAQQIRGLLAESNLMRLNIGIFSLHFALMAAFVAIPTMLSDELSISGGNLSWVYLGLLGGGFFVMLPVMIMAEKLGYQKLVFVAAVALMALTTAVLSSQRGPVLTPLMLLLFFAAFNLLEATLPSWLSKLCPVGNRGTAMGIYSTSQFFGAFAGGLAGGWSMHQFGLDGLFVTISLVLLAWAFVSTGLQSPRPLQTLVLSVGNLEQQDFLKIVSNITGVEDILLVKGEQLAYVQIDRLQVDMPSLQPYLNR